MATKLSAIRGCLLGLAAGDAMGVTVDEKTYPEICETYGPAGLLGYDLVNGFAEISSHTQIAAFCACGLILAQHRGRTEYLSCVSQALKEWAHVLHLPRDPRKRLCWLSNVPTLRRRRVMDARTLDALTREVTGTVEQPANSADGAGTLTGAVAVGLFYDPERMDFSRIGALGAGTVALTHGAAEAFLSGAVLSYIIAGILQSPQTDLRQQFLLSALAVEGLYPQFPEAARLRGAIEEAIAAADRGETLPVAAMEAFGCTKAAQVLCGALYAVLAGQENFDEAIIIAVNHSGKSAATGAVTGAILGAWLGEEALPDFYLECLECGDVLKELAADLESCSAAGLHKRLFDDDWDRKYTHGQYDN